MIGLAEGLIRALPKLITKVPQILEKLLIAFTTNAPKLVKAAVEMINILAKGLIESLPSLIKQIPQLLLLITEAVIGAAGTIAKAGYYIITGLWQGIKDNLSWLLDKVKSIGKSIVDTVKSSLGIHSPSRVMRDEIGKFLAQGIYVGFNENDPMKQIKKDLKADISTLNGITMSAQNNLIGNVVIDYSKMAQANAEALQNANLGVTVNGRQFGRVVREAI